MNNTFNRIGYLEEDNLVYAKKEDVPSETPVEIDLINTKKDDAAELSEEEFVAGRISSLISEGYKPSDIVILVRNNNNMAKYEKALQDKNIACYNPRTKGFFENPEILLMTCLLNSIDNPRRDIYLAGALRSPVFGFSLDELERIRESKRSGSLYDAMISYSESSDDARVQYFISFLKEMREYAQSAPIDALIWQIYSRTSILGNVYSGEGGDRRYANLMSLYEYARKFESSSFKGLYNFISYVEKIKDSDDAIEEAKAADEGNSCVRIMSIHASKGLEFRVVFLVGAADNQKSDEKRESIYILPDVGIGMYTPAASGIARVNGINRVAVAAASEADRIAEEMRVLYVALTRAKERLIITGKGDPAKIDERVRMCSAFMSPFATYYERNYLIWILSALEDQQNTPYIFNIIGKENVDRFISDTCFAQSLSEKAKEDMPDKDTCISIIKERFSFRYDGEQISKLPAKMSVSHLYPTVLDDSDTPEESIMKNEPLFMADDHVPGAAERGTATHVFMQFCNLEHASVDVDGEIERLIDCGFIPSGYRDMIDTDAVSLFFRSELWRQMQQARRIWREQRFNIALPARMFTGSEERSDALGDQSILVQGVIDCFFETDEGDIILLDYKTDRFSKAQKSEPDICEKILRDRHADQLSYYREAIKLLIGKIPQKTVIYSFSLGRCVEI